MKLRNKKERFGTNPQYDEGMKVYFCHECGETRKDKFYKGSKSMCYECQKARSRARYDGTGVVVPKCKTCGEVDPRRFYPTNKSKCARCLYPNARTTGKLLPTSKKGLPYICRGCGKTGKENFYDHIKYECKTCYRLLRSIQRKEARASIKKNQSEPPPLIKESTDLT